MPTFLSRFALYALSAITVSLLALIVLALSEKRLKSSAAFLLTTILLIRIFVPTGIFGVSFITLGDKTLSHDESPTEIITPLPSIPSDTPSEVPSEGSTSLPPAEVSEPFWENEVCNTIATILVFGVSLISLFVYLLSDAITRQRLKRSATRVVDPELLSLYTKLAESRHLDRLPALYATPHVTSPCLVGLASPRIYLPSDAKNDTESLKTLLSHELEHFRTGDLYVKFFALSLISFQWWNPFLYRLIQKLDLYLEEACDERVLKGADSDAVLAYSSLMLALCKKELCRRKDEKLTAYFSQTSGKDLKIRIAKLLDGKIRSRGIFLILAIVLIAISSLFLVGFAPSPSPDTTEPPAITTETPSTADDLYPPTDNPDSLVPAQKEGHTFSHWENIVTENGDTFLKAIYTPNTYTVILTANGGKIKEQQTLTFSETLPAPVREGYTFGGWYSDAALTQPITAVPAKDITVYAYWREETPTAYFTYEIYQGAVMITAAKTADSIVMPAYIGGLPVAHIGKYAFENATVTDIVLPYTLQTIGVGAFYNCRRLQTVTLFEGIRYIDRVAFDACYALSSIYYHGSEASWHKVEGKDSSLPIRFR